MRLLVCGSRSWRDAFVILDYLYLIRFSRPVVIDGTARGPDSMAHDIALALRLDHQRFPADWRSHGRRAGAIRNRQMLAEGKPDRVVAFWDGISRGTAHMIQIAREAGIQVEVILQQEVSCVQSTTGSTV